MCSWDRGGGRTGWVTFCALTILDGPSRYFARAVVCSVPSSCPVFRRRRGASSHPHSPGTPPSRLNGGSAKRPDPGAILERSWSRQLDTDLRSEHLVTPLDGILRRRRLSEGHVDRMWRRYFKTKVHPNELAPPGWSKPPIVIFSPKASTASASPALRWRRIIRVCRFTQDRHRLFHYYRITQKNRPFMGQQKPHASHTRLSPENERQSTRSEKRNATPICSGI